MLTESDKFYLSKHPELPAIDAAAAMGKKPTKKMLAAIAAAQLEAAQAAVTTSARDEVSVRTGEKGKKIAAMTAAGAMRGVTPPPAASVPSRHLRNSVHKIGGGDK